MVILTHKVKIMFTPGTETIPRTYPNSPEAPPAPFIPETEPEAPETEPTTPAPDPFVEPKRKPAIEPEKD